MKLPTWLQSSADREKLSLTVQGSLHTLGSVILLLTNIKGWHLTQTGWDTLIDGSFEALAAVWATGGTLVAIYGGWRRWFSEGTQK